VTNYNTTVSKGGTGFSALTVLCHIEVA